MKIIFCFVLLVFVVLCFANSTLHPRSYVPMPPKEGLTDDLEITTLEQQLNVEDMVEFLIGLNASNVDVTNMQYIGAEIASGIFTGASSEGLPIASGVILSSGFAENIYGPNTQQNITGNNSLPGSEMLDALIPGYYTNDASVLEFDFTPKYNTIGFTYVFGSDEYLEYVGSDYNDVFGLIIDGQNIALIPGTDVTVAINSVNNVSYSEYYTDNPPGFGHYNVEADGFTVAISVRTFVQPEVAHHIAFAVADAGDHILDSWVFLEKGSFHSEPSMAFFDVIIEEGTELSMFEDETMEIHATAIGVDEANFIWTLHQPQHGFVEFINSDLIEEDRTILYTPEEDYNGMDYFIVSVQDNLGGLINRYIEIELAAVRDKPVCTILPYIYGDFWVDEEVSCYLGEWNDIKDNQYAISGYESIVNVEVQWQFSISGIGFWEDIEDADRPALIVTEDLISHYIRCKVIATDTGIGVGPEDTTIALTNVEYCGFQTGTDDPLFMGTKLNSIHPNPFNPSTTFDFTLSEQTFVNIEIFNIKGQLVKSLSCKIMSSGYKHLVWNGADENDQICPSGIYFARVELGDITIAKKLMLLK